MIKKLTMTLVVFLAFIALSTDIFAGGGKRNGTAGAQGIEQNKYERFMRFTGMPAEATIKIVSLAGVFITQLDKDATTQYVDWNLQNSDGLPVSIGLYIAYIDMPGIGTKILKLALIQETQYIDRI